LIGVSCLQITWAVCANLGRLICEVDPHNRQSKKRRHSLSEGDQSRGQTSKSKKSRPSPGALDTPETTVVNVSGEASKSGVESKGKTSTGMIPG
jgi:hypothetical protein